MNSLMKMRMVTGGRDQSRQGGARNEYQGGSDGGSQAGYRSGYDGGSRAGYTSGGYEPIEDRFRDRTGREHYDNGRFAPMRSEMAYMGGDSRSRRGGMTESRNQTTRSMDEMRGGGGYEPPQYRDEMNDDGMRRIYGFGVLQGGRSAHANYHGPSREPEMGWRGGHTEKGYSHSEAVPPMNRAMAEEWMASIKNEDGTVGPHWSLEQVKQLMQQRGINNVDPVRVWVAMNADYSDRVAVNRKYGLDKPDYYLDAALAAWINDKDAVENKESAYYMYVVK